MKCRWTGLAAVVLAAAAGAPSPAAGARDPLADAELEAARAEAQLRAAERVNADRRRDVVSGALEGAVEERRDADAGRLVPEPHRASAKDPPADSGYVAAKALYHRADLPAAERRALARAAFEKVGPPFELQARYFLGVLDLEEDDLSGALRSFESCARAEPRDDRARAVRDLCLLALGRVNLETGEPNAAIAWYASVPRDSPRLVEALHEQAWAHVRAKQLEAALALATFVAALAPDSPTAAEATLLRGHVLLRLGRHAEAAEAYSAVANAYAPVGDELDAAAGLREGSLRAFEELAGAERRTPGDLLLPAIAAKWAREDEQLAEALELARAIDGARRGVRQARDLAEDLEVLLRRGGALDAFPDLLRTYAQLEAAENAAASAEAGYAAALGALAEPVLSAQARAELEQARAARRAIETRFALSPRRNVEVDERLARRRARVETIERELFQLRFAVDACGAAISGLDATLARRGAELARGDDREKLGRELREHRAVVDGYEAERARLRREIAESRGAAGALGALAADARVREQLLQAAERERRAAEVSRGALPQETRAVLDRIEAARRRLAELRDRAATARRGLVSSATRRAEALRAGLETERLALVAEGRALEGIEAAAREVLAHVATEALARVRARFAALVAEADAGIVDVAWTRKRQRVEQIQQLAAQEQAQAEQFDRGYRTLLREAE